jgi:hypothetical protein
MRLLGSLPLIIGVSGNEHAELVDWMTAHIGTPEGRANQTADKVCEAWPGEENWHVRRQKALHYLQLVNFQDIRNNTEWLEDFDPRARRLAETDECGSLGRSANNKCRQPATWGYKHGIHDPNAPQWYEDFEKFTGVDYKKASQDDWQKFYFCVLDEERHCGLPPCRCTYPPCDICRAPRKEEREKRQNEKPATSKDLGFERQCNRNPGCQDIDGDCCPGPHGMEACCTFTPKFTYSGPTWDTTHGQSVPEEDVRSALDNGHYLGPLENTYCKTPKAAAEAKGVVRVTECSGLCSAAEYCDHFTFTPKGNGKGKCQLYTQKPLKCDARYASDGTSLYLKNKDGYHPHRLPDKTINAKEASFMALGDWGSLTCPGRESMHYKTIREPGSDDWKVDHDAQLTVAATMRKVAAKSKPFLVLNVGDNFYWGGIPHKIRGGRGVHDQMWNLGFEMVYDTDELTVPWIGVVGNHDYGGDGCFSDIRAQFDYTLKDMLNYDRWKMPSPYFTHKVNLDGFSIEYFMVDTNFEDSANGRHGGICAQFLCPNFIEAGMPDKMVDEKVCQQWFRKLYNEQEAWLPKVMAASTADWKILGLHHKPMGFIERQVMPHAVQYGAQLVIAGHTHETSVFNEWPEHGKNKRPLLVVGQGGGSQGIPGCGKGEFCGTNTDYSFANLKVNKDFMTVTIHRYDECTLTEFYVTKDAQIEWEKPEGAPDGVPPLKVSGCTVVTQRPRPKRPSPASPVVTRTFKPLPTRKPQWTPSATVKKDGKCECSDSKVPSRPGCARHMNSFLFCYIEGDGNECPGSRFSSKVKSHWRKCTPSEVSAVVV